MMYLRKPSESQIRQCLQKVKDLPFSYAQVGASRTVLPQEYFSFRYRRPMGKGRENFVRVKMALQNWQMLNLGWFKLYFSNTPIEKGQVICTLIKVAGVWFLNPCRIVYVVDGVGGKDKKQQFGFAYGTLPGHVEQGEELFLVEWSPEEDTVWYEVRAFSKHAHILPKVFSFWVNILRTRLLRDSTEAIKKYSLAEEAEG